MKKTFIIFILLGSLDASSQNQINSAALANKCKDYLALIRNENSGFCMGYFIDYYKENTKYWDLKRSAMDKQERFFWDTFFPCRIPKKLETGIIEKFMKLVIQNPEFSDKIPPEIIMYTYQDECIE